MNPILLFFLLSLSIQIIPRPSTLHVAAADIVIHTCKQAAAGNRELDFNTCLSVFNSTSESRRADLKGLAIISIRFTKHYAQQLLADIDNLIKQEPKNTFKRKCLSTCEEIYSDAVSNLEEAVEAVESGRINDARIELSASFDAADTCEECFPDGQIQSPLTKEDDYYTGVARVSLAVAALLDQ
ncbi:putative invertase inhibitor [Phalaenopsis equestris]|uniref:putative invertase inhibitor n=1 Tax=Phalaenopsis equestris TaxID=78828 RepID=UPI0009E4A5E9|nr:putative invertase inhibitor [Phalaenopsis equestris]